LKNISIVDFHSHFNISNLIIEPSGKLLISYFDSSFHSYWFIKNDKLLRVTSLCQTNIVAVVSSTYIYFLSMEEPPNRRLEITIKEIDRIKLSTVFDSEKMQFSSVG
jgi:hypothetical protein